LQVYQLAEKLADEIWQIVQEWNQFAKDTMGKQIVRSADSIGANIAVREAFPEGRDWSV
jgi:four helix bundle protein